MIRFSRRDEKHHSYFEERLSAYLDGELAARERRAVEQHLKGCDSCRWELATLKQTVAWLTELPAVPLPRAFTIPANVVPAPPERRRWSLVPAMQFATAMVAVLLFFAAAGDVMLTGWPWATTAEPMMMQEAAVEQPVAEAPVSKEEGLTLEVEAPAYAEPFGAADTAATEPAAAEMAAEAPEEAPQALQQPAPEAESRAVAPTERAAGQEPGGGEPTDEQGQPEEGAPEVAADAVPSLPPAAALEAQPDDTPAPLPTDVPAPLPTVTPTLLPRAALTPTEVFVPTPATVPTVHPPATDALEPPTAIVQAREPLPPAAARDDAEASALTSGESWAVFWLRILEYVLGVALVVLMGTTIALTVWRRRARRR